MGKTRKMKKDNKSKRVTQRRPRNKIKKRKNKSNRKYKRISKNKQHKKQKKKQKQTDITLSASIKKEFYKLFN